MHRGLLGVNTALPEPTSKPPTACPTSCCWRSGALFRNVSPNEQRSSDGWAWGGPATLFSTRYAPHTGVHYDEADSDHPGLIHAAMADGRCLPVNWNIDLRTWNNLGNYAQGVPLEHPEFRR